MFNQKKANHYVRITLGIFLVIIGILAFFNVFYYGDISIIFWFCYLSVPLAGVGILLNNSTLVKSQLYILAIPDLIWTIDLIYYLLNGRSFLGIIDYLFLPGHILPKIVTLQHIITVPIMFYSLILFKNEKTESWKISIFQVMLVFILTKIFTSQEANINCVYNLCGSLYANLGMLYPFLWFAMSFLMIYISRIAFIKSHRFFTKFFKITS